MAAKSPYFKTHKYYVKGVANWSWKVYGRNGEVIAQGKGLNVQPTIKYIKHLAEIMSKAVKHLK